MGKKKALIVGINEYEDPGFERLKYAESDAKVIYDILINPDIGDFKKEDVILLTGKSKSEAEENLETILSETKRDDLVFIYFAGHGKLDRSGKLCLASRNTKTDRLLSTSIHLEDIRRMVDNSDCKRVVFIIDSCFSGAVGQSFRSADVPAESLEQISGQGKVIISASQAYERARERDDIGHGIFTYNLVKGLEGEADHDGDGYISVDELYRYVCDRVKSETKNQQVPMKWGMDEKGEIIIAKSIKNLERKKAEIERLSESARGLQNQERFDEALDAWNKVLQLDSKNTEAPQTIKQIEEGKKKRAELEAKIDKLFEYYQKRMISPAIYNKAIGIIRNPYSTSSNKEEIFTKLVEDLLSNNLTVENFVLSWNRIQKLESQTELERLKQEGDRKDQIEGIIQQKEEHQKKEQIDTLYKQALELVGIRQWRQASEKIKEIQTLDPQFADPEGIATRVREELERETERLEQERREREAREKAAREEAERKAYEKAAKEEAERRAREEKESKRKTDKGKARYTSSPWMYGVVGGLIVLVLLVVELWKRPEPKPGPQPRGQKEPGLKINKPELNRGSQVLYEDNFTTLDPAWGAPNPNLSVKDGKLILQPEVDKRYTAINQANSFEDIDFHIKVSLAKSGDPSYGGGLIFWAKDNMNYYTLSVSGNGWFRVERRVNGHELAPVAWRENAAVKKGLGEWNQLRVVTKGSQAAAYINDTEVMAFNGQPPQDDSFIGVFGDSPKNSQNVWEFSDLKINKLEPFNKRSQVLYEDNFTTLDPAWGAPSSNLSVKDGKLIVQPSINSGFVALRQADFFNDIDATIKVSMAKSDDPSWGGGLVFWAKDKSNYYALLVSGNGQFSVRRYINDRALAPVDWRENASIKKGIGQVNELRIVTKGNQATAYINDMEVIAFNGQPPNGGSLIGVKGSSAEKSQIVWEFSGLKVTKP
jgi:tetratricopeptide (TPR) repeat protein